MAEIKWIHSEIMVKSINELDYPILVLTGPSGAGKSTLSCYIESEYRNYFKVITNHTTREKRSTDKASHFKYLSSDEFDSLKENNQFFLARYTEFPSYGYTNDDLSTIISLKKIPIFMFRFSGLARILELINNVYVINICANSQMSATHSHDVIMNPTAEMINDTKGKIESICTQKYGRKIIQINNNYDDSFFTNAKLIGFIKEIISDKGRFN